MRQLKSLFCGNKVDIFKPFIIQRERQKHEKLDIAKKLKELGMPSK